MRLGADHRRARVGGRLSLRAASAASGTSRSRLWRFERGLLELVPVADLGAWCAVVGLELAIRAYPAGDPIRDRAQLELLERLRSRLHPALRWRTEVPLGIAGDLRAWDAEISGQNPARWRARVEAETGISDGQAVERRLNLKTRDDPDGRIILLVSDTRVNRTALRAIGSGLMHQFPLDIRAILASFARAEDPGGNGIVIL